MISAAQEQVLALVCGLPQFRWPNHHFMVLQAFIDDSRSQHQDAPGAVFVLAGYISDAASWVDFAKDWQAVLDMPPAISAFKMADFAREFGLSDPRLPLFRSAIERHAKGAVSVTIEMDIYRRFLAAPRRGQARHMRNPYYLALMDLVIQLKRVAPMPFMGLTGEIRYIFDEQEGEKNRIRKAWAGLKTTRPDIAAFIGKEPQWEDDEQFVPLQAADMIAWWTRRHREERLAGKALTPFPWSPALTIPQISIDFDERNMASVVSRAAASIASRQPF